MCCFIYNISSKHDLETTCSIQLEFIASLITRIISANVGELYRIFYFYVQFLGAFRQQLMNFVWKYIFLITQDLRSKFTPIVQFEWWDWRSRNLSSQDYKEHSENFSKPVGKSRSRKFPQGFLKTIISYCLQNRQRLEFHAVYFR